jgi:hypothetical protein
MVALALATMIAVMITFISTRARQTYQGTVQQVEIYNRFRLAMNTLQKDFAGWVPTMELEFYIDGRGGRKRDSHWQPGEELPDRGDELAPKGVVDGGMIGEYDEYAYILQRQYESQEFTDLLAGDLEWKLHDAYQVYFRTMTYVDGEVREANIEYMLVDPTSEEWVNGVPPPPLQVEKNRTMRLALYKVVRYFVINADTVTKLSQYPITRRVIEVATNVTDFRVEYITANPYSRTRTAFPDFRTPEQDYRSPVEEATRPKLVPGRRVGDYRERDAYRKLFGYGSMKLEDSYPRATVYSGSWGDNQLRPRAGRHDPVRFGFQDRKITFAELTAGDRIFIFKDADVSGGGGPAFGGRANPAQLISFPSGDYTIRANLQGMLEFREDIDCSSWDDKDQRPVNYKAAFLPSAVRITLRMVNDEGLNPKTMQQTIWLRRKLR